MTATLPTPVAAPGAPGAPTAPVAVLRAWAGAGQLAERFPEVPALLADLDEHGLRRAGAVLARLDADAVRALHPDAAVATVAVTGSSALQPLAAPLAAQLARHGFVPRVELGGYRQYAVELLDADHPLFAAEPDLTVCVLDADDLLTRLPTPWTAADAADAAQEHLRTVTELVAAHRRHRTGPVLLTTPVLPRHWAAQLVDLRSRAELGIAWRRYTTGLLELARHDPGVFVVDMEPLVTATGALLDPRLAAYTKVQFTEPVLGALARELGHVVRALRGRVAKCLVLDLDGTTWGGILAEDGPLGIVTGEGPEGEAFTAVQRAARQIAAQGPLLAVCSKNDAEAVRRAFQENPDLTLTEDDLAVLAVDWGPKPDNLRRIADELGIGVDSLVFVDDSPSERGLVRASLPTTPVVGVEADEPALHLHRLLADGWFTAPQITEEDRGRARSYRTERRRVELRAHTGSVTDYLVQLDTAVSVFAAGPADVGRLAQLTQRTNQFNLTTVRLDAAAVGAALVDPARTVLGVRCADRFGDFGVVGAVFTTRDGDALRIDNLLLSCRVLARGVEDALLHVLLRGARDAGARSVTAAYRPTPRNARVAELYPSHGFRVVAGGGEGPGGAVEHVHELTTLPPAPAHVRITEQGAPTP